jgi:hypothetical protein
MTVQLETNHADCWATCLELVILCFQQYTNIGFDAAQGNTTLVDNFIDREEDMLEENHQ